jgi:Nucleotidyl transferase AbiEii toxin, Type IV TA system
MLARLDEALRAGCGGFTFERSAPRPIGDTRSVGFEIKLSYRGRRWGTVRFEVAPAEGDAGGDIETLEAVAIDRFGLEGPERVPCLGLRYQIAQKIHACTAPPPPGRPENLRVHDLIDLLLLRDLVPGDGWAAVRNACVDTFTVRGTHSWPPPLAIYPSWPQTFTALATELAFAITDVQHAAQQVRAMIKQIDNA